MKPAALPASSTGQWRACCGSSGRELSRRGRWPTPGRRELGYRRTSMVLGSEPAASERRLAGEGLVEHVADGRLLFPGRLLLLGCLFLGALLFRCLLLRHLASYGLTIDGRE